MNEQAKSDAISLAEKLNLKLRSVVERALPEYFEQTSEQPLQRAPEVTFRKISDTQSLQLSNEFYLLERKRRRLEREEKDLIKLYKTLRIELRAEIDEILREQDRLDRGIFYGIIEEQVDQPEILTIPQLQSDSASASTSLITPSEELRKSQKK